MARENHGCKSHRTIPSELKICFGEKLEQLIEHTGVVSRGKRDDNNHFFYTTVGIDRKDEQWE